MPPPTTSFTSTDQLLTLPQASVVRPTWYSAHSQALAALKEIGRIHVVVASAATTPRHRTKDIYTIETYRSSASKNRIPTNNQRLQAEELLVQHEQPAASTTRSYDDFVELRHKIYHHVHGAHESVMCVFCDEVVSELIGSNATPNFVTKLLIGDTKVAQRLTKFLNFMLEIMKINNALTGERRCSGQAAVPLLLHAFLLDQELPTA